MTELDFDKEFEKGPVSYNSKVGEWWNERSKTRSHSIAYKKIALFIKESLSFNSELIVDYACGSGQLLNQISLLFPTSNLMGLDGSEFMLKKSAELLKGKRVHLMHSTLPNFSLPIEADMIVFNFPNIVPKSDEQSYYDKHGYKIKKDVIVSDYLSETRELDPDDETVFDDSETLKDTLLTNRVISRNLRSLVKKGGYCIRVEYSNCPREELSNLVLERTMFEEGSLKELNGFKLVPFFKIIKTVYIKSKVIEDVYHQTKDETDKVGGFYIVLLKAI